MLRLVPVNLPSSAASGVMLSEIPVTALRGRRTESELNIHIESTLSHHSYAMYRDKRFEIDPQNRLKRILDIPEINYCDVSERLKGRLPRGTGVSFCVVYGMSGWIPRPVASERMSLLYTSNPILHVKLASYHQHFSLFGRGN
ncbi:hypothetical protein J6590_074278 [Homalodisca vitripennis]|nr:hypothetical protein J6590_074278 [Homalodisca vitripennis]